MFTSAQFSDFSSISRFFDIAFCHAQVRALFLHSFKISHRMKPRGKKVLLHTHKNNGICNSLSILIECVYFTPKYKSQLALTGHKQLSNVKKFVRAKVSVFTPYKCLSLPLKTSCQITTNTGPCKWLCGVRVLRFLEVLFFIAERIY